MTTAEGLEDAAPTNAEGALLATARAVQLGNYRPAPMVLTRGEGRRVWDVSGKEYLDLSAGIAVLSVGHAHPRLARAIAEQAARLMHVSNLFYNDRAIELAAAIVARTPFDRIYFGNSGAEANEAMFKLARRYFHERGEGDRNEIVSTWHSFHGRTMGALTLTGQPKYHVGMGPLVGGVSYVEYDDLEAMEAAVGPKTAAVILEPIQAEGGIRVPSNEYLEGVRALCDRKGALLLFDEVQTGYGRTGKFLGQAWSGVVPDACSLAKGIAGGFPLSAMAVTEKLANALPPGAHASTFGGNPLACAAGLAVLDIFDAEGLVGNAAKMGAHLRAGLDALVADAAIPAAVESRGRGLLQGVRLADDVDPAGLHAKLVAAGLLVTLAGGDVVRVSPSLDVTVDEIDRGLEQLRSALRQPPRKQ
jgi:predicted acetylornithine/succinylornithine family transaminase